MLALETQLRDRLRRLNCYLRVCGEVVRFYRVGRPKDRSSAPEHVPVGHYTLGTGHWTPERGEPVACGDLVGAIDRFEEAVARPPAGAVS